MKDCQGEEERTAEKGPSAVRAPAWGKHRGIYHVLNTGETAMLKPRPCPLASARPLQWSLRLTTLSLEGTLGVMKPTSLFHK